MMQNTAQCKTEEDIIQRRDVDQEKKRMEAKLQVIKVVLLVVNGPSQQQRIALPYLW